MTDFLYLEFTLLNTFHCYSLSNGENIDILFRSQQGNFYYYQNKKHYGCVLLSNDNINYNLVGFVEGCTSSVIVNNNGLKDLIEQFS